MVELSFSYADLEYFLFILTRVTCFIFIVPFFNGNNSTPRRVKVALGVFISILVYNMLPAHEIVNYTSVLGYTTIILKEAATGLLIGFSANICTMIMSFAGHMVDMDIGLSMASLMDPSTRENTTLTGLLYQYAMMLMLICTGMYQYLLKALIETFTLIPINGAVFHTEKIMTAMVTFLSEYIIIGFRICLPVFATITLLNAILGILAKSAPQLNMFSVGMQLKILIGLAVMFVTAGMLPDASNFIFIEMKKMMVSFVQAMLV
ncbi:MAG: flagellar biosynthetic protein FliR [Lachnospiraceae bacterium]|nr:flagellar biosynthetic protein FliR [Lachnospiraceae bacterium]